MSKLRTIEEVVDWRLCIGCGACTWACREENIRMVDLVEEGLRPVRAKTECGDCDACLQVCPVVETPSDILFREAQRSPNELEKDWRRIEAIYEGHATDENIRFRGSSGGALSALAIYCMEQLEMEGTLHIGQDHDDAIRNSTRLSRTPDEVLEACGSRYSPASVCDGLELVENASRECVIIGKPAEIAATRKAMAMQPTLSENVGVTMSFFCAETPPTRATKELCKNFSVDPGKVSYLRYRGLGWPGYFTTQENDLPEVEHQIYHESWAFLQSFRPWSTQLWPDGTGELADITCGDPWYEEPDGKNPGFSIIVARTERGKSIIEGAISSGYIAAKPAEEWKLIESQKGLLKKRASIWGRRLSAKLFRIPVTEFRNNTLYHSWKGLGIKDKLRSTLGTVRRIITRRLYKRKKSIKVS